MPAHLSSDSLRNTTNQRGDCFFPGGIVIQVMSLLSSQIHQELRKIYYLRKDFNTLEPPYFFFFFIIVIKLTSFHVFLPSHLFSPIISPSSFSILNSGTNISSFISWAINEFKIITHYFKHNFH